MINGGEKKTEHEQIDFFERCHERFLKAKETAGAIRHFYRVGGTTVCVMFAGENLVPYLAPALEHLRMPGASHPADLTLCIWDSNSTSIEMVPVPCTVNNFTERGEIWGFDSDRMKTAFHWVECSVNLMDRATKTGIYWVPRAETLPPWTRAAPLRTLFHWWMEKNGCQLLHAAAVATDDGAVLLTGRGGIGKSTTALACLQSGLYYLADDYLIVRLEPEPLVFSLYCTAKLNGDHVVNFPRFSKLAQTSRESGREKAVMFLYPEYEDRIVSAMPLKAILMPQFVNGGETKLSRVPGWDIQRAASFTTMSQLPHAGRYTHDFICRLSSTLPGYTLEMGRDMNTIPRAISDLLEGLRDCRPSHHADLHDTVDSCRKPLVSVVIPVSSRDGDLIKAAVENVVSQNYPALELIIVGCGSTNRIERIISQLPYDVRYLKQENGGPASARNGGVREASGELIAFLDVRDLWPDGSLNFLVGELLHDPDVEVIYGHEQSYEHRLPKDPQIGYDEDRGNPAEPFRYSIGAGLYRKSVFAKVGLFAPPLLFGEDDDWFGRLRASSVKARRLDRVTLLGRRRNQNLVRGGNAVEPRAFRALKMALDQKRAKEGRSQDSE